MPKIEVTATIKATATPSSGRVVDCVVRSVIAGAGSVLDVGGAGNYRIVIKKPRKRHKIGVHGFFEDRKNLQDDWIRAIASVTAEVPDGISGHLSERLRERLARFTQFST
ncbi:MAG TPA: hypothetical protein VGY55_13185 [Pirellulales bacterium]|jgi:hypothetical protein|nr:hypothetical protein [Pirellulales bacterium]